MDKREEVKEIPKTKTSFQEKVRLFVHFFKKPTKKVLIGFIVIAFIIVGVIFIRNKNANDQISKPVKVGEKTEITLQQATVNLAKESVKEDTVVTVKAVSSPKLEAGNLKYASKTYEFTSSQKLEKPVVITLKYDPAKLPDSSYEDYLYIGVWENNQWVPVQGGIINKTNHTLTAATTHFSLYSALCDLNKILEQAKRFTYEDKIDSIPYEQLPTEIASDVGYSKSDIAFIQKIEVCFATKASYFTEVVTNAVSKVSGLLIGDAQSNKDLEDALEEMTAQEIIGSGGATGEVTVKAYKLSEGGEIALELAKQGFAIAKGIKDKAALTTVYAKAISWILDVEMDYINKNIEPAFKDIWQYGSLGQKLTIYIVYIDAPYKNNLYTKGMKYYYFDDKTNKYVNYYNDLVAIQAKFTKTGEVAKEITVTPSPQVTIPEKVVTPAMTIPPSPQVKTTTGITTVSEFKKLPPPDYGCGIFSNDPKKPITMELTIISYYALINMFFDNYQAKDLTGTIEIVIQHRDDNVPDGWVVPSTKLEIGKTYILTGCKPYIGTGGPGEGPIVFGVREDWEGSIIEKK